MPWSAWQFCRLAHRQTHCRNLHHTQRPSTRQAPFHPNCTLGLTDWCSWPYFQRWRMVADLHGGGPSLPLRFAGANRVESCSRRREEGSTVVKATDAGNGGITDRMMTDADVVERIRAGDIGAYEILVHRYHEPLRRRIATFLRGDAESEDIMQEAHVRALTRLHQLRGAAQFPTWLTRIAVNRALQYLRSGTRLHYIGDDWLRLSHLTAGAQHNSSVSPEKQAAAKELRAAIETALKALPPSLRSVFVMKEIERLSTSEISARLGITPACMKTRLHRARKQLRPALRRAASVPPKVGPYGQVLRNDRGNWKMSEFHPEKPEPSGSPMPTEVA